MKENNDKKFILYMILGIMGLILIICGGVFLLKNKPRNQDADVDIKKTLKADKIEDYQSAIIENGQVYYYLGYVVVDSEHVGEKIGTTSNAKIKMGEYENTNNSAINYHEGVDVYSVKGLDDCIAVDEEFELGMFLLSTDPDKYKNSGSVENIDSSWIAKAYPDEESVVEIDVSIDDLTGFESMEGKTGSGDEYMLILKKDGLIYMYQLIQNGKGSFVRNFIDRSLYFKEGEIIHENN